MIEQYRNLAAFSHWAYSRIIDAINEMSVVPEALVDLLAHAVTAEKVWYLRITASNDTPPPIWPKLNLDRIQAQMEENKAVYEALFEEIGDSGLSRAFSYKTSKGIPFTNTVSDILDHLTIHGSYHRGQMNRMIRESGGTPAMIDYILFKR